ncbi:MAG: leucine-rich repeat domain-containing protein [Clostridia bacterium]|nr:leucine-rich repeat domain-containing protein [Clostridia bacterium]
MYKLKRAVALILCAAMLLCFVPAAGAAETEGVCGDNLTWALEGEKLIISGTGRMYDYKSTPPWCGLEFSEAVIGDGVTSIGSYAFYKCDSLKFITVPAGITSVGKMAFAACDGVYIKVDGENPYYTSVNGVLFNKDETELIAYAKNVSNSYSVPSGVKVIAESAFYGNDVLEEVSIPSGVTSIGSEAFAHCDSLMSITLPSGVISIGDGAFCGCWSLESITLPTTITSIGEGAFDDTYYYDHDDNWDEDGALYIGKYLIAGFSVGDYAIKSGTLVIADGALCGCDMTGVTIPSSVKKIGNEAFYGCYAMTSATIKSGVTSIGDGAFAECYALESITIPSSVKTIGDNAFYGCYAMTSATIKSGAESIGNAAFAECYALESIIIPSSVKTIGDEVFYGCYAMTSATIKSGAERIGDYAFAVCFALESITIPSSVTEIGDMAFYGCDSLTSITIPSSVTKIGDSAFESCEALENISLSSNLTSIGSTAFGYCYSLREITIPSSVTSIGIEVFIGCDLAIEVDAENLYYSASGGVLFDKSGTELVSYAKDASSYVVPDGVETICDYAFEYSNLKSVTIPASVTSICDGAFYRCIKLDDVYYGGSGKEWESVAIGSGNYFLLNASIYPCDYVYEGEYYYTIKSISENGTVKLVKNMPCDEGGVLAAAKYRDGILIEVKLTEIGEIDMTATTEIETSLSAGKNETLKAFVWKGLNDEVPLSDVAVYEG